MSSRPSYAEIHLGNLNHNLQVLRGLTDGDFLCPMVKANAYGHGDVEISRELRVRGVKHLGVVLVQEGIRLREAGDEGSILLFGLFSEFDSQSIISYRLTPVVGVMSELHDLKKYVKVPIKIHLKFNTGMNRLGFETSEASAIKEFLDQNKLIELEGICTHLYSGEDAGESEGHSFEQIKNFQEVCKVFSGTQFYTHALNSSAAANIYFRKKAGKSLLPSEVSKLGVRPGNAIYGGWVPNAEKGVLDLRPVMALKSRVVHLRKVHKGSAVSYGPNWNAKEDSLIGVVPFGYADGYSRLLSNKAQVLCHGHFIPQVGTVCMDYFMIDLTNLEKSGQKVALGDEVVLIGNQLNNQILASDLAEKLGTISYEVVARISDRVPRVYRR